MTGASNKPVLCIDNTLPDDGDDGCVLWSRGRDWKGQTLNIGNVTVVAAGISIGLFLRCPLSVAKWGGVEINCVTWSGGQAIVNSTTIKSMVSECGAWNKDERISSLTCYLSELGPCPPTILLLIPLFRLNACLVILAGCRSLPGATRAAAEARKESAKLILLLKPSSQAE